MLSRYYQELQDSELQAYKELDEALERSTIATRVDKDRPVESRLKTVKWDDYNSDDQESEEDLVPGEDSYAAVFGPRDVKREPKREALRELPTAQPTFDVDKKRNYEDRNRESRKRAETSRDVNVSDTEDSLVAKRQKRETTGKEGLRW